MTRRNRPDERATGALFSGQRPAGREDLADVAAFAEALRAQATAPPAPSADLAELLAEGLVTDHQPAPRAASSPIRRSRKMLEVLLAKFAALGLTAKAGIAGAAVIASVGGAGAADVLPGPLQDGFDQVSSAVTGDELPDEADDRADDRDGNAGDNADNADNPRDNVTTSPEDGCEFGHDVATAAGGQPDEECTEDEIEGERPENPGDEGRTAADDNAGTNGSDGRDTADDAANDGQQFGDDKATEGQETGDEQSDGAATSGDEHSDGAATSGDEHSDDAATSGDEHSDDAATSGEEQSDGAGDEQSDGAGDEQSDGASTSGDDYRDGADDES